MATGDVIRAQWAMTHDSGLPKDEVQNVFHFRQFGLTENFDNIRDMLNDFYNVGVGAAVPLNFYLSSVLAGPWSLKLYNLSDTEPRVPVAEYSGSIVTNAVDGLPSEVACVVSWQCAPISGVPAGRLRGRTYVGPLSTRVLTAAPAVPRPNSAFLEVLVASASRLVDAAQASLSYEFVVNSAFLSTPAAIEGGFVDNAFDTQRRRGEDDTARTAF